MSSPQLIVSRTRVAGRPTVFARGELDLATAPDLGAAVRSALRGGDGATLDLTGLTFADSSGLRLVDGLLAGADGGLRVHRGAHLTRLTALRDTA